MNREETRSDVLLKRLLTLHPKLIDLTLDRVWRILDTLGNPQRKIQNVVHLAGTNDVAVVVPAFAFGESSDRVAETGNKADRFSCGEERIMTFLHNRF